MELNSAEKRHFRKLFGWHLAYMVLVAGFFSFVYLCGYFRTHIFLTERFLFLVLAPVVTICFVLISPWRRDWVLAIKETYVRLEGQVIFCILGAFVLTFGFYIYSIFIWGLGALGPSLVYM